MRQKVLILCSNYEASQFPRSPDEENRFYTYGFGGHFGRIFSKHLDSYDIEVWRTDSYIEKDYYESEIGRIKYKVFRSKLVKKLGSYSLSFLKELKKEVLNSNAVLFVVHTHNFQTYQIAFFLRKAMIITTHHGDWSPFFIYKNSGGLRKLKALLGILAEKLTLKYVDHFLICDHKQERYIQKSAPGAKWSIFSTGLDVSKFKLIPRDEARRDLGLEPNKKYILYVGKLYKYKQVKELLEIWKSIKQDRPEIELLLAGNEPRGSWGEEYYDMAEKAGAKIIGRVLNNELYRYFCASDVYVLIGLREDNFGGTGIAPLESLACNTPVVSSTMVNYIGDNLNEVCEVPNNLEDYKKAILKVLDNPSKYKRMRESVEKYYDYTEMAKRADVVIKQVLSLHNKRHMNKNS